MFNSKQLFGVIFDLSRMFGSEIQTSVGDDFQAELHDSG